MRPRNTRMYPADFKYTKDHEWVNLSGGDARVGITDYAQKQLGDVVYLELPEVGRKLTKGDVFGTIESVKAVAEVYSPLAGEIVEINDAVVDDPELINEDPHHEGWLCKIRFSSAADLKTMMNAEQYEEYVKSGEA